MSVAPEVSEIVQDVRNDNTDCNWAAFAVEGKIICPFAKGCGGREEMLKNFANDKVLFALLRTMMGDQESKRTKFVFITWVGPSVSALAKGKATTIKGQLMPSLGQFHIEITTDDLKALSEEDIYKRLKVAGGADYDTGSNKGGTYKGEGAGNIKAKALESYLAREKDSNIGPVKYVTTALPKVTPVDLKGRAMVAPPTEALKNIADNINNVDKWSKGDTAHTA